MNNRYEEIDTIIQTIKSAAKKNEITTGMIYNYFKKYGISDKIALKRIDLQTCRSIEAQLKHENDGFACSVNEHGDNKCLALEDYPWQEFTTNHIEEPVKPHYAYKVYLPVKPHHEYLSLMMSEFLVVNKIVARGLIALTYRSDSLIIYLTNAEDCRKIAQYFKAVENQGYNLDVSLGENNPFIPSYGKVGFVAGKDTKDSSYLRRIAKHLANYFESEKQAKRLDRVSADDFIESLSNNMSTQDTMTQLEYQQIIKNVSKVKLHSITNTKTK